MVTSDTNNNDEFFQLLTKDGRSGKQSVGQTAKSPFDDEIVFKDIDGTIKVIHGNTTETIPTRRSVAPVANNSDNTDRSKPVNQTSPPVQRTEHFAGMVRQAASRREELARAAKTLADSFELKETFEEQALEKRFSNIIISRLKGIRNRIETREMLMQSTANGGMGFDAGQADRVLNSIEQELVRLSQHEEVSRPKNFGQLGQDGITLLGAPEPHAAPTLVFTDPLTQPVAPMPKISEPLPAPTVARPTPVTKPRPLPPVPKKETPVVVSRKASAHVSQKPKIEDVKFKPKSMGPIGEIQSLTIEDFRRLGDSAEQSTQRVMEKIALLEQESFGQKIEAIKAWQQSGVYQQYLTLGKKSMEEKKPVAVVISELESAGQPTLTQNEFEAVSDLNQRLRH